MKLVRIGRPGVEYPGAIDSEGGLRDLSTVVADVAGSVLLPESLAKLRGINLATLPRVSGSPRLGPCVGSVGKFICIGLNYSDHAAEAGMPSPVEPVVFMKATSAICGANDNIVLPRGAQKVDWEVELGVVIGLEAKYVTPKDALKHVAGYCVVNDLSDRALQLEGTGQWVKGKSADTFGPIGPWLVTADEVPDPQQLGLWLEVDGQGYQSGSDQQDDLQRGPTRQLRERMHEPSARRHYLHRHAARSWARTKTSGLPSRGECHHTRYRRTWSATAVSCSICLSSD